jgi:hypothetical protein
VVWKQLTALKIWAEAEAEESSNEDEAAEAAQA